MDFNDVKKLMKDFNNSPTRELEITTDGFHIHLSKNEAPFISQDNKNYADSPAIEASDESIVSSKNDDLDDASLIKSPMVGTVYLQPEPEKAAYVSVGSHVHKGDVVCIIEAMKMMTEIKSEYTGEVVEILVDNEDLVEFDQPLFKIKEG